MKLVFAGPPVAPLYRYCVTCEEDRTMTVLGSDHLWKRCPACEEYTALDIEDLGSL